MGIILCIVVGLVLAFCPTIRCALSHPVKTVKYAAIDLFLYISATLAIRANWWPTRGFSARVKPSPPSIG